MHPTPTGRRWRPITVLVAILAALVGSLLTAPAASAATVSIEQTQTTGTNRFQYSAGDWFDCGSCLPAGSSGGTYKYTTATGAATALYFTGTKARIYGVKESNGGTASIQIDGVTQSATASWAGSGVANQLIYETPTLAAGTHVLKFTRTAGKLTIDRAEVDDGQTAAGQVPITRTGNKLYRGTAEYKAVGFNSVYAFGCGGNAEANAQITPTALSEYFGGLPDHSVTRVWVTGNSTWQSTMDLIVAAAEANDQYLLVTLSDANDNGTQCFSNKGAGYPSNGEPVRTHAQNVVTRYKDSAAIMAWEIINEGSWAAADQAWYNSIATAIDAIDPNTLIMGGFGTCYNNVGTANWNQCKAANSASWNDFVNFHEYDNGVSYWTTAHTTMGSQLNKPVFVGEFGFCCGGSPNGFYPDSTFGGKITDEWTAYLNTDGISGALYWSRRSNIDTAPDVIKVRAGANGPVTQAWTVTSAYTHQWQ